MAGARGAIQDAIRTKLIADATLQTLCGAAGSDKRVYSGYDKAEHLIDTTKKSFVVVFPVSAQEPDLDREAQRIQVSCYAKHLTTAQQVADRADAVLHRKTLSATGWTDVSMRRTSDRPVYNDGEGTFAAHLDFEVRVY